MCLLRSFVRGSSSSGRTRGARAALADLVCSVRVCWPGRMEHLIQTGPNFGTLYNIETKIGFGKRMGPCQICSSWATHHQLHHF